MCRESHSSDIPFTLSETASMMATLDYIDVPSCATRLDDSRSIQPAQKILTTLPRLDPQEANGRHQRSNSNSSSPGLSVTPMAFIPQLLMGSIPTAPVTGPAAVPPPTNPRKKIEPEKVTLLSSRDPLSLPIMTNNFKRFVAKVGPVFWFQDRVEEVLFWKRGWKRTTTWMALYAFLCRFMFPNLWTLSDLIPPQVIFPE